MLQTSNSLLSPTKSMVARGNQWYLKTNIDTLSMIWDYDSLIMGIRPQNMAQTSNFLLSPTKSIVARGNQWHPRTNSDTLSKFWDYEPFIVGNRPQNVAQAWNSLLSPTKSMVAGATNGNQGQKVIHFQSSETMNQL